MFSPTKNEKSLFKNINANETWILFPHKNSKKLSEKKDLQKIKNVVILDCTWFQTDQLISELEGDGFHNFVRL
jgi:ribosome biogenesis protein Tsr3